MIRKHSRSQTRSAFTLVELIVVLLIILILVGLLGSAVFKALQKIPEVQTRTEISELEVALRAFMTDYGLSDPPPSTLFLNEQAPLSVGGASASFLTRAFGKNLGPTDWNGDNTIAPLNVTWVLQGHQCLVFYLGGPPSALGPQGFSTNNSSPAMPGGKRKGPYFTFVTSRLMPPPATAALTAPNFPVYVDPWQTKSGAFFNAPTTAGGTLGGTPYAYFSSNGINNGYSYTDCSGLGFLDVLARPQFALPYYTAVTPLGGPTAFTNSNTYQIISAGKDGVFGYTLFVPPAGVPPPPVVPPLVLSDNNLWIPTSGAVGSGADDQTNFSSTLLGSGQN
ncbi:MAG TPA: prepilin-type N-terminal cleavage/methylation domain-containing protein [Gemmataceae bacterium]|jgi:prepilin-type N-terminal cleavage/methylation domain-containing protein